MSFDSLLVEVGAFGHYQKLVICLILLPAMLPCAFHAYSQLFIAARPSYWCKIPELEPFMEEFKDILKNLSIPIELKNGKEAYSECRMYNRNYTNLVNLWSEKNPYEILLNHNYLLTEAKDFEIIDCNKGWHYDRSIFTSTVISEWNLVCDKDHYPTIGLVIFGVAGLIGNYIFGYLQDGCGRKFSFYAYLLLEIVACVLSAFTWNFSSWLTMRFVVGLTVPAILSSPYVLAIELVGPDYRVLVSILSNIAYSIGLTFLAVIVFWFRDWKMLTLAVCLPFTLLFCCYYSMPESPRWLVARHRYKEAAKIMRNIARINGKRLPQHYEKTLKEKSKTNDDIECTESTDKAYGISDLFTSTNLMHKTIIITFIWFCNTSVYVGLSYYAPALGGDEIWNFFLAGAVELPTYLFLWPGLSYFGRRYILCISMIVGGIACLSTFIVQHNQTSTLVLYCIGKMGISSGFVVLPLIASELYPTVVRGLGMSFSSVIAMIGPILIPMVNFYGSQMTVLPLIIMGVLLSMGGVASLFLPETKGSNLPQTLEDGELVPLVNPFKFFQRKDNEEKNFHVCDMCKLEIRNGNSNL